MAVSASEIEGAVNAYLTRFPGEAKRLKTLLATMREPDKPLRERATQPGHVTAAVLLMHPDGRVLYLVDDKRQRLLRPEGHLDISDPDLPSAARRELFEETGIPAHTVAPFPGFPPGHPIDIAVRHSHGSKKRDEAPHEHWAFCYPMVTSSPVRELLPDHAAEYRWLAPGAAPPPRAGAKLAALVAAHRAAA